MKPTLVAGLTHVHRFTVTAGKTVPALYPEAPEFTAMPAVFATGYMVGLFEWACIELIAPHLDPGEGSLGTAVNFTHTAATPPGLTIAVTATLTKVDGRSLDFHVSGHDGLDPIGEGAHRRAVVTWDKFTPRVADKLKRARDAGLKI
jgi:fluoroacetyl-CoA thioesterase